MLKRRCAPDYVGKRKRLTGGCCVGGEEGVQQGRICSIFRLLSFPGDKQLPAGGGAEADVAVRGGA